jgi:hypothetical protein
VTTDEQKKYPEASKTLFSDLYVDDYLGGTDDFSQALQLQKDLTTLLPNGGFHLMK